MRHRSLRGFRDVLLTTTALVAALVGGGKGAAAAGSSSGLSGFQVQAGGATLSTPSATKSVITQSTSKAIISWSAFGIPAGSTVQFVQPGSSSVALNRVTGGSVSQIQGNLSANGQVWIVNPAGVFFGAGAQVDVAGLMATTSDIQNGNFLSGNYQFGIGSQNPNAGIVNQGTIRVASGGSAVLSGAQVTNQGLIEAQLGSVVLAGAKTFTVDFQGDKLLSFQVTGAVDQRPNDASGAPAKALVTNAGTVSATGGTVLLTARAAKNIIDNVINSTGIVEATSAKSVNGEIVLDGGDTGLVSVSGTLDASGKGAGETGGTVKVLGDQVALASTAKIDVSGDAGGGTALVGGNFHGSGPEQNAATTTISAGARIDASAISSGTGGKVAVWSDTLTSFAGTIAATGGSLGGNGGYVETSGQSLSIGATAKVDTSAAKGTAGTWLLDPVDFTVDATASAAIISDLGTSNVVVETSPANSANGNGDIVVNAAVIYGSSNGFSLLAVGDILVNASILNTQSAGGGAVNLVAGWNGTTGFSGVSGINSPGAANIATIAGTAGAFGNAIGTATGSVFINSAAGATAVAVGSATGPTTVLANNVTLQGGSTTGASAQLGFNPVVVGANIGTNDVIDVTALGNVSVLAGTAVAAFAQIGDGGYKAYANSPSGANPMLLGTIGVSAGGSVLVQAGLGANNAFAQIGNGGYRAGSGATLSGALNVGGSITVTAATNISVLGGAGTDDYAQIGHGGMDALRGATSSSGVTISGAISLTATGGSIDVAGGTGINAFAMIGNGGRSFGAGMSAYSADISGTITVVAASNIAVLGGSGTQAAAMIGNGGRYALGGATLTSSAALTGDVTVTSTGGQLSLIGGGGYQAFTQIGDGGLGFAYSMHAANASITGNISATALGDISLLGGSADGTSAQIGLAGNHAFGSATLTGGVAVTGNITLGSSGSILLTGGGGTNVNAFAVVGNGGRAFGYALHASSVAIGGNIEAAAVGAISLVGGGVGAAAQIGHGGLASLESAALTGGATVSGNIAVDSSGSSIGVTGGTDVSSFAMIGDGGRGFGYRMTAASAGITGGVTVTAAGDISVLGGTAAEATTLPGGPGALAQIGHGGQGAWDSATLSGGATLTGYVSAVAGGAILVQGGSGISASAQIGNGGRGFGATLMAASAEISSPVTAIAATSILVSGGATASGALIGNGGRYVLGAATLGGGSGGATITGDISVSALGGTLSVIGGGYQSFAQIGTGGRNFGYGLHAGRVDVASNISVIASSDVSVLGGIGSAAFAQIGNGGYAPLKSASVSSGVNVTGTILAAAGGSLVLEGGTGNNAFAQIGHGGASAFERFTGNATLSGAIDAIATGNLEMLGGSTGMDAYAQIGHGGAKSFFGFVGSAAPDGDVAVLVGGNATLAGGNGQDEYVQIGQGGAKQGKKAGSYGTPAGSFTNSGSIAVIVGFTGGPGTGTLSMLGGTGTSSNSYVLIGHGGNEFFASATLSSGAMLENSGNIFVGAYGSMLMQGGSAGASWVQVGNGGAAVLGGQAGTAATRIAVLNTGNIIVDVGTTALAGTLSLAGGTGALAYAMIGDGGPMTPPGAPTGFATFADVINQGSIVVDVGAGASSTAQSILAMTGGTGTNPLTLGNGTTSVTSCGAALAFCGGAFAQIGDGGAGAAPTTGTVQDLGDITVQIGSNSSKGNISLTGANNTSSQTLGASNYAQIGDGGAYGLFEATLTGNSGVTGTINVGATGNITLQGGTIPNTFGSLTLDAGYVQIGNGGAGFAENGSGSGSVTVMGDVTVTALGSVALTAGSLSGIGNDTLAIAYAQIGNGGEGAFVNFTAGTPALTGNVEVQAGGDISLTGSTEPSFPGPNGFIAAPYAQIGNGDAALSPFGTSAAAAFLSGNIDVRAGGTLSLALFGNEKINDIINLRSDPTAISNFVIIEAGAFNDGGTSGIGVDVAGIVNLNLGFNNVSVLATGSDLTLSRSVGGFGPLPGALNLVSVDSVILKTSITSQGAVNLISGWDGLTGLPALSAGNFNPAAVAASASAFGNGGHTIDLNSNVTTRNAPIEFIGPVVLSASATVDTTSGAVTVGGSSITFLSSIDDSVPGAHGLTLVAGPSGDVGIDGQVGGTIIGPFKITEALNVAFTAPNPGTSLSALRATSFDIVTALGTVGSVGSISTNGFQNGTFAGTGGFVDGGPISITAAGAVSLGPASGSLGGVRTTGASFTTATTSAGNGGDVFISAASITIPDGIIARGGDASAGGSGGHGGAIVLDPPGPVSIGATGGVSVESRGGFGAGGGGNGGNVSITGSSITLDGAIQTFGGTAIGVGPGAGGAGGTVSLTALGGVVTVGRGGIFSESIAAEGGDSQLGATGPGGAAGTVIAEAQTVTFSGGIYSFGGRSTSAGSSGAGGLGAPVTVTALSGPVTIGTGSFGQSIDSVGGYSALGSNANAGAISVFGNGVSIAGSVFSFGRVPLGSSASGSNGGAIVLNAGTGSLSMGASGFVLVSSGGYSSGGNGAGGAINLTGSTIRLTSGSPVTISPGSGTLSVSGSVGGSASVALLGTNSDNFDNGVNLGAGTLDLSNKTAGSVTVTGLLTAAGLLTGTNPISISLLGGADLGDPNFQNTGTNTFAGAFIFSGGLTIGALSLAGDTEFIGTTNGVTLGTVNQGANTFEVIADSVTLNGDWIGTGTPITGPRLIAPFSFNAPITLGTSAAGFFLNQAELDHLSGGAAGDGAQVVIGSGLNGAITTAPLTFNDPLTLIGSNITVNGLTKNAGMLTLLAFQDPTLGVSLGQILGSVTLAGGTGEFVWGGHDGTLSNTTINGDPGGTNSILNFVTLVPGSAPGPFIIDGFTQTISGGGGGGGVQQSISQSGGSGAIANLIQNTPPNTGSNTPGPVILLIQPPTSGTSGSTSQGQGSTDTGTTGTGTTADQAVPVVSNTDTGTPADTPSSTGDSKPTGVPNLFQHNNNGLGGGTGGGGTGGTLENAPSL